MSTTAFQAWRERIDRAAYEGQGLDGIDESIVEELRGELGWKREYLHEAIFQAGYNAGLSEDKDVQELRYKLWLAYNQLTLHDTGYSDEDVVRSLEAVLMPGKS